MKKDELYKEHLQEVLSTADINTYSEEDIERVLDRLLKCLPNNGKLYKYRSIEGQAFENAYDSLKNGYLWMAKANTLNDDYDCAVKYNPITEIDKIQKEYFKKPWFYLNNWVRANIDQLYWQHPKAFNIFVQFMSCVNKNSWELDEQKAVKTLVKNGMTRGQVEEYINTLLQLSRKEINKHSEDLRNPNSSMYKFNDINREDLCVFSLSEDYDSDQMWAYYANSNKGFCIEYDLSKIKKLSVEAKRRLFLLYKVEYKEELEEFSFDSMNEFMLSDRTNNELLKKANEHFLSKLLVKAVEWKHEREWRFMHCIYNADNKIYGDIVSGIIIDERVLKTDNAKKLIDLAKEKCWTIKIRKKNYTGTKHIYEELKEC